jgi:pimeloyl-ACP methyl ester carboxylesterase
MGSEIPNSETITLADGRTLCFARWGANDGRPVIYFHGAGSSRIEGEIYDKEARAAGVQIIATDRPGCGGSSPAPGRTFLSYADDVAELADALGIERFVAAGMSNGGVYTMAIATRLAERVTAAIPINSSTPLHDPIAHRATPFGVHLSYALIRFAGPLTLWSLRRLANSPKTHDLVRRSAQEVLRQPNSGYLDEEVGLASADWGFDHAAIAQPAEIFTGDRDAGYRYARIWAERLPAGRLHVYSGGHGGFADPEPRGQIVAAMAAAP